MAAILLESKLHIPAQPPQIVSRPHLLTVLESEVAQHNLTLISAPAGYGKTTLLAEWARTTSLPVAWLTITGEEDDLEHFLRYLFAAWDRLQPEIVETPAGILLEGQHPDMQAVLAAFINAASRAPAHLAFILDDYHTIEDSAIQDAVGFMLDHLPPRLHFILSSRSDPPLPLARYRARRQLFEIRSPDLEFTQVESAQFLIESMGLDLSPEEAAVMHAQTEGWAAGLQLAALRLRQRHPGADGERSITGRQRFISDYLSEDVLDQLPPDVQLFLLQTSILDRLCGTLCEAVTGTPGGQPRLEQLERQNLFVQALDDERTWFRFHPLFADFLRGELERRHAGQVPELHRRAAAWYAAHDLPEQAFHHALSGDHAKLVLEVIDKYFNAKLNGGEFKVVQRWVDSIPASWYEAYPVLDLMRAGLHAYSGAFEACIRLVDQAEQRLKPQGEQARWQMARVQAVRCFIACFQNDVSRAQTHADRALRELPHDDGGFRPAVYGALGDAYRRNGHWEEARQNYLHALDVAHSPTIRVQSAHVFGALADLELRQGRLQAAAGYWRRALAAIQNRENWGRLPLPAIGWVYIRMGELLYEWNQLDEAWEYVSRGLERAGLGGDVRAQVAGYLIAARLKLTLGEVETAQVYLAHARAAMQQVQLPEWISQFERFQLELWLAQDRLRTAVNWSDEMLNSPVLEGRPESVVAQLAMARVLIVRGDDPSLTKARVLLEHLLEMAEEAGQLRVAIEALALLALLLWKRGDTAGALSLLERALRVAEPEGYVRLFADLGLPMARLLQEARSRQVLPDYIGILLSAFGADLPLTAHKKEALPEPLTDREGEVLKLIAAGLTNREIADELVISSETVKKHAASIYAKLGASNRTEAASRARELDLLG